MKDNNLIFNKVYNIDSRRINEVIKDEIIDVTITSPPYFNLKDYGSKNQIGYGQSYEKYLDDLKVVFQNVFNSTKDTGSLWVIIDTFKKNGEMIPLPFDFVNTIKPIGWKLQEVIIWGKDRTVPWAHKGQMRNVFEYILLSKSNEFNFYINDVRDFETLKKWWVKYPERYNPKGKTPHAIWQYDIPTQGSWGKGYIKHFCPLPEAMIGQMLKLTTKENNVVLDPFSGSGAVLSKAHGMKRKYLGFELNKSYIKMFDNYLANTGDQKIKEYETQEANRLSETKFQKLILDLRVLKFARIFYNKSTYKTNIRNVYVEKRPAKPKKKNALVMCRYIVLLQTDNKSDVKTVYDELNLLCSKEPLSKFGVEWEIIIITDHSHYSDYLSERTNVYSYSEKNTHHYRAKYDFKDVLVKNKDLILSKIKVTLNESDYE